MWFIEKKLKILWKDNVRNELLRRAKVKKRLMQEIKSNQFILVMSSEWSALNVT